MAAQRWVAEARLPRDLPLLNFSQAAPAVPPPEGLRQAMADALIEDPAAHLYGPVLGNPALREALAARTAVLYGGPVAEAQIGITSGCNQAFAAAVASLAGPGDEVILPVPWYFNHKMWLDMSGAVARPLETARDLLPDPEAAAALIGPRTRAIALVSPNNPAGVEYPPALLAAFRDLCRARGLALILDETYRDFHSAEGAPHDLFADPDWDDTLIHLYSFSKAFRLTGHRVGAVATSPARLAEIEKALDTVTICPAQPGQIGALWGLRHLGDWLAGERREILARRAAMAAGLSALPGWRLDGCGAYFAYAAHPWSLPSDTVARRLVSEAGLLMLPDTMFRPSGGGTHLRIAFANADAAGLDTLFSRLAHVTL
ncbi:aminotransferase [Rhodobacteraceae bacterium CCMM004]|nr:aminotransferase [Rhodobacteraceae bacterium CCMM004]